MQHNVDMSSVNFDVSQQIQELQRRFSSSLDDLQRSVDEASRLCQDSSESGSSQGDPVMRDDPWRASHVPRADAPATPRKDETPHMERPHASPMGNIGDLEAENDRPNKNRRFGTCCNIADFCSEAKKSIVKNRAVARVACTIL